MKGRPRLLTALPLERGFPSRCLAVLLALCAFAATAAEAGESVCYGSTAHGRLESGCKLPYSGEGFTAYSRLGWTLGRTYVHCRVAEVVEEAYASLHRARPESVFVYGETGWASGGPFKPHKTHQNGLSVDFMVPMMDRKGRSIPLPTGLLNKYGYGIEIDDQGRLGELAIDFEAMAQHLLAVQRAAAAHGVGIRRVIFDLRLQPALRATPTWTALKGKIQLSTRPAWVRHDEHYHVDFQVPCRPLP